MPNQKNDDFINKSIEIVGRSGNLFDKLFDWTAKPLKSKKAFVQFLFALAIVAGGVYGVFWIFDKFDIGETHMRFEIPVNDSIDSK